MTMKQNQNNTNIFSVPSNIITMPPDESNPESSTSSASDECEFRRNSSKPQQLVNVDSTNTTMEEVTVNPAPASAAKAKERRARTIKWGVARLYPICRLEEYSPEQICQTWYQPSEYAEISRENIELIDELMVYGTCQEDSICTARGLEHMTDDEIRRRKRLRDEAVDAVMDEQDRQHYEDRRITPEPDAIARVYAPIALRASKIAQRMGLQDQQIAHEIAAESLVSIPKPVPGSNSKRTVQFCTNVKVHSGLHLDDYSSRQIQQCWYTESDVKCFKADSKKLIKSLIKAKIVFPTVEVNESPTGRWSNGSSQDESSSHPPNPITVCIRGLEPYLCSSKTGTRKDNVIRIWNAVLDEQDRQDSFDKFLPAHLAQASRDASEECVDMARKLAQQDEHYVAVYLAKDLEQLGIRIPHQSEDCASPQRRGSFSSSSMPYRVHRDYRRDSLSVAGAASKTGKNEECSTTCPPSFIAIREGHSTGNEHSHTVPVRSPHPLASKSIATNVSSILSSQLDGKIERELIDFPPFTSETSKESNSSSESASADFNMLKTMAKAINKQHLRKSRFLVLDRKD